MKNFRRLAAVLAACFFLTGALAAGEVKNVIWIIGDGMGPEAMGLFMQGVRYAGLEEYAGRVSNLEKMMNSGEWGLFFNNTHDTVVTDSAASATQMATGRFSRPEFIGMDYNSLPAETFLELARIQGKAIVIITDTSVADATPAGFTAHAQNRNQKMEIARQLLYFAWRRGIRIPRDLSVVCFNEAPGNQYTIPPLDTLAVPGREMGVTAARVMVEKLHDPESYRGYSVRIPGKLLCRESSGPFAGTIRRYNKATRSAGGAATAKTKPEPEPEEK